MNTALRPLFYFKEHLFLVTELLKDNLYEYSRYIRHSGAEPYFTLPRLKSIMRQLCEADTRQLRDFIKAQLLSARQ